MGIKAPSGVKFELIKQALEQSECTLSVSEMCRIAGVSRSGYYNWIDSEDVRQSREAADRADFELIVETYRFREYANGTRGISVKIKNLALTHTLGTGRTRARNTYRRRR